MTGRIITHNRIVIAICKEVETTNGFGIEVFDSVCAYESANLGIVIASLKIIQTGFGIVIVASVAEGVDVGNRVCAVAARKYCAFTPSIICIRSNKRAVSIVNCNYVAFYTIITTNMTVVNNLKNSIVQSLYIIYKYIHF